MYEVHSFPLFAFISEQDRNIREGICLNDSSDAKHQIDFSLQSDGKSDENLLTNYVEFLSIDRIDLKH